MLVLSTATACASVKGPGSYNDVKRSFYNGRNYIHGLKHQTVENTPGQLASCFSLLTGNNILVPDLINLRMENIFYLFLFETWYIDICPWSRYYYLMERCNQSTYRCIHRTKFIYVYVNHAINGFNVVLQEDFLSVLFVSLRIVLH